MTGAPPNHMAITEMALALCREGFCVIPVGQAKRPCVAWGRYADAAPAHAEVERLFDRDGVEGVAVICGPRFDLAVLDIDNPAIVHTLRPLIPPSVRAAVPWYCTTRGFHLWFRYPRTWAGDRPRAVVSRCGAELILRRHYAICPPRPSAPNFHGCHRLGVRASLLPLPEALLGWFGAAGDAPRDSLRGAALLAFYLREGREPIAQGQRNTMLFRAACYAAAAHRGPDELAALVEQATAVDGLPRDEALACLDNALAAAAPDAQEARLRAQGDAQPGGGGPQEGHRA